MPSTHKPDLDNANVGMTENTLIVGSYLQSGGFPFLVVKFKKEVQKW